MNHNHMKKNRGCQKKKKIDNQNSNLVKLNCKKTTQKTKQQLN